MSQRGADPGTSRTGSSYGRAALKSETARVRDAANSHKALYRAACRCGELVAGGELDEDHAAAQLFRVAVRAGRPEADARRTIAAGMRKGQLNPRQAPKTGTMVHNATEAKVRVAEMRERAARTAWPKPTHHRVLTALHEMAMHAGKLRIDASFREVGERAGVSVSSVSRAVKAMEGVWLRVVKKGARNRVKSRTLFQLLLPTTIDKCPTLEQSGLWPASVPPACSATGQTNLLSPAHDLWANRPRAWEVYRVLVDHGLPVSASDLAQSVGASRSSVYHVLTWLCGLGLVVHQDRQWVAIGEEAALQVVATLNLPAVSEARRERFTRDREEHRARIAEKATTPDGPDDPALSVYGPVFDLARAGSNPKVPGRRKRRASIRRQDSHRHGAA